MLGKAQTLTFYNEGQPIENGSEVVSSRYNEMIAEYGKQLKLEPAITLTSSADAEVGTVYVTLKSLDQHSVGICAWGDCVNAGENNEWTVSKTNDAKLSADTPVDMIIEYLGEGSNPITFGTVITVKAEVSAWYEGNEASKISFTLVMTSDPALGSVDEVTAASPVVRAEAGTGTLVYSLPCESAELSLYSIGGVQALAQHLSGSEGTVSLAGLTAGLYIYRLQGGVSTYGKIIVK